eukprot:6195888-Pleurochrysis_carterae.AAC.1
MRTIYERLRHTNRRYGGAVSVGLRRLAVGACGQIEASCGRFGAGVQPLSYYINVLTLTFTDA